MRNQIIFSQLEIQLMVFFSIFCFNLKATSWMYLTTSFGVDRCDVIIVP
jgi:hypothetical protein